MGLARAAELGSQHPSPPTGRLARVGSCRSWGSLLQQLPGRWHSAGRQTPARGTREVSCTFLLPVVSSVKLRPSWQLPLKAAGQGVRKAPSLQGLSARRAGRRRAAGAHAQVRPRGGALLRPAGPLGRAGASPTLPERKRSSASSPGGRKINPWAPRRRRLVGWTPARSASPLRVPLGSHRAPSPRGAARVDSGPPRWRTGQAGRPCPTLEPRGAEGPSPGRGREAPSSTLPCRWGVWTSHITEPPLRASTATSLIRGSQQSLLRKVAERVKGILSLSSCFPALGKPPAPTSLSLSFPSHKMGTRKSLQGHCTEEMAAAAWHPSALRKSSYWGWHESSALPPRVWPLACAPEAHSLPFRDQATRFGSCWLRAELELPLALPRTGRSPAAHGRLRGGAHTPPPWSRALWLSHQAKTLSFLTPARKWKCPRRLILPFLLATETALN